MNIKQLLIATILLLSSGAYGQSFEETKLLAEQGDANAQYNLGNMYIYGNGVPENDAEAVKWYRLAAEQGLADAQASLAYMYYHGLGVPQNNVSAYIWSSVAAAQGHKGGSSRRILVSEQLTRDQLARGQEIATKCFDSDYQDCE